MKVLFSMAIGVVGGWVYDEEPYASAAQRKHFVPLVLQLKREVQSRALAEKLIPPKYKNWNKNKLVDWLARTKITNPLDKQFVSLKVGQFASKLVDANKEREEIAKVSCYR